MGRKFELILAVETAACFIQHFIEHHCFLSVGIGEAVIWRWDKPRAAKLKTAFERVVSLTFVHTIDFFFIINKIQCEQNLSPL